MTNILKKITDKTMATLLKKEIVLPSNYLETFNKNAKDNNLSTSEALEDEINTFMIDEMNKINHISNQTIENIDKLVSYSNDVCDAIEDNDSNKIDSISHEITALKHEIENLMKNMYRDDLTKQYNKKWLYNNLVDSQDKIKNKYQTLFLKINDIEYISKEYSDIIGNNVIKFIINTIIEKIKYSPNEYSFVRYSNDTFIIFFQKEKNDLHTYIHDIDLFIKNSTLKTKSGLMLKTSFSYTIKTNYKDQEFLSFIEDLSTEITQKELEN